MNMEEQLRSVVETATSDGELWHTIIHGNNITEVQTEGGKVPTVAKQMLDVRNEVVNNVIDYLSDCIKARDNTYQSKEETLILKNQTQVFRNEAEEFKNQAQTTFNNVSSTTEAIITNIELTGSNQNSILQNTGSTEANRVINAVESQIAIATEQARRAENATDSKLNITLNNISMESKTNIMRWLMPNWSKKETLSLNTDVTIAKMGWILMRNTAYQTNINGYINGSNVFSQCGSWGNWQEWNSLSFFVDVGDIVKLTAGELLFIPCKGS